MNLEKENELLKTKIKTMSNGLPWRIYLSLRNANLKYLKRKNSNELYDKSIQKIEKKALNYSSNIKSSPELSQEMPTIASKHPSVQGIYELNSKLSNYHSNDDHIWVINELAHAVKNECYEVGMGLVNYLTAIDEGRLTIQDKAKSLPLIISTYIAFGSYKKAKEILFKWGSCTPANDLIISISNILVDPEELASSDLSLPSGKLNSYLIDSLIEKNLIAEGKLLHLYLLNTKLFESNPQNYLLLFNYFRIKDIDIANSIFNKFTRPYSLPEIHFSNEDNFLRGISHNYEDEEEVGPKISVIISCFNASDTIDYAINSLLNQSYKNIEILIGDDCSEDRTWDKLKNLANIDKRIILFKSDSNQGPYNIRNKLIDNSSGEFITFQDADDYSLPNRIELQLKTILAEKTIACTCRWIRMTPTGRVIFFKDQAALRMSVVSLMMHRNVYEAIGNYRPTSFASDTEYFENLKLNFGIESISTIKSLLY